MAQILVIDDEPLFRDYLRRILQQEGHSVLEAGDGEHGLRTLDEQDVDLVIVDIVMPKKDGIEVLMELRRRKSGVGVIAISGRGRPSGSYLNPAKALGAARTLMKPFARGDLIAAVHEVLNAVRRR